MAANLTDYAEDAVNDHLFGKTALTMPTAYLMLLTADPTDAGVMTNEVPNSGAYARQEITTEMGASSGGVIANSAEIAFAQATGSWGTVTYIGVTDSGTWGAGNMIFWGQLTASKAVDNGDTFKIAIGDLEVTLT